MFIGKTDKAMTPIKDHIAKQFVGKSFHFKCECIFPIDITGTVKDYEISGNEIILLVDHNGKIIHIGLNTTSLQVQEVQ